MPDVELRSKTELSSIAGTENIYVQEAGSPYTVKKLVLTTIRAWLKTYFDTLYAPIILYPVGSFYVQYPDAASSVDAVAFPVSGRPATMYGGTWVEQFATDNVFFKTGNVDGQTRTNGLSADQVQSHIHFSGVGLNTSEGGTGIYGSVTTDAPGSGTRLVQTSAINPVRQANTSALKADGANGTPRTGTFTEPQNRLMKIWKRTVL